MTTNRHHLAILDVPTTHASFDEVYPVATADMSTEALIHEATLIEADTFDILDLTEGATFAAIRWGFIRTELRHRGVIA